MIGPFKRLSSLVGEEQIMFLIYGERLWSCAFIVECSFNDSGNIAHKSAVENVWNVLVVVIQRTVFFICLVIKNMPPLSISCAHCGFFYSILVSHVLVWSLSRGSSPFCSWYLYAMIKEQNSFLAVLFWGVGKAREKTTLLFLAWDCHSTDLGNGY